MAERLEIGVVVPSSMCYLSLRVTDVIIQLDTGQAGSGQSDRALGKIRTAVKSTSLNAPIIEPLHPKSPDPVLSTFYRVVAPDVQSAAKIVEAVRRLPNVAAAYTKPEDEAP